MDPMRYRDAPPPASGATCITDGGMETVLAFHRGIDLPCFASFPLLMSDEGRHELRTYFEPFATLAQERGVGLVLDTPTWRANADWGAQLGYDAAELAEVNRTGVALLESVRSEFETDDSPVVISGCVGPRSDAYRPAELMTAAEAERYHGDQIGTLSKTAADVVTALTLAYAERRSGSSGPQGAPSCRSLSRSRWRRTAACRTALRCATRSSKSTPRRTARRPTS
jgi:homocysteine S-methyltransferase